MKNREKYRDEILNSVLRGNGNEYCEFVKKNVLPNLTDCTNGECDKVHSCGFCRGIFTFWLDEEYTEPPKPEIDWDNVPVDTLVRVRDSEEQEWTLMYFKGIEEEGYINRFQTWVDGATSKTSYGVFKNWIYCELVEDEENGK